MSWLVFFIEGMLLANKFLYLPCKRTALKFPLKGSVSAYVSKGYLFAKMLGDNLVVDSVIWVRSNCLVVDSVIQVGSNCHVH